MRKLLHIGIILGVIAITTFSGCGGGSSNTPTTITLSGESSLDGVVHSTGYVVAGEIVWIGDSSVNTGRRAIFSFPLSSIPAGSTIQSALLRIYQPNSSPTNGYALGAAKVDHINFTVFGTDLYNIVPISTISGSLATSFSEGWKEIEVTSAVQNDLNNSRSSSQYRLYHVTETNNDDAETSSPWCMSEHATYKPQLVVTYNK